MSSCSFGKELPLPDGRSDASSLDGKFDVIISGAGPAGLFLTLLLSRLGLSDSSLLCIDSKDGQVQAGHADGIVSRTMEIFRTLGIEGEFLRHGGRPTSSTVWDRLPGTQGILQRVLSIPFNFAPARYPDMTTIHQGWIEKILLENLRIYSSKGVSYSTELIDAAIDDDDPEFPVIVTMRRNGRDETVRARYLVGADGSRSIIRKKMSVEQEVWSANRTNSVIDLVVDTNFPDIRRIALLPGQVPRGPGFMFMVPRERLPNGNYLTRMYIDMTEYHEHCEREAQLEGTNRMKGEKRLLSVNNVIDAAKSKLAPYRFDIKEGTKPDWFTTFNSSQRLAKQFSINDQHSHPRVFLVGDACHTHSPSQGQGMNTGLQDSYNLSWKLAYAVLGLSVSPRGLLKSYSDERLPNARRVLDNDKRWNFSDIPLWKRQREEREFVTCCGIEYDASSIVAHDSQSPVTGEDYVDGILRPGRRMINVKLERYTDGVPWDLHDDFISNGRFRVVLFCAEDFPSPSGQSYTSTDKIGGMIRKFPHGLIDLIIIQPYKEAVFLWEDVPSVMKELAEMRTYHADASAYATYGVSPEIGAVVVVRPDGVIGTVLPLAETERADGYFERVLEKQYE